MKRVVIGLVILLILLLGGGVYYTLSNLDSLIASVIEHTGSEMTGTRVRVGSVSIDLRSGRGTIRKLRVSNPAGFSAADAFSLGEITLQFRPENLTSRPLLIEELSVKAPEALYEVDAAGRSNLVVINENLDAYAPASGESTGAEGDAEAEADALRMTIRSFAFEDAKVSVDASAAGGKSDSLSIPRFQRKNVGGSKGETGAGIGEEILTAFTKQVISEVAAKQLDNLIDEKVGGEAGEASKKLLRRLLD